MVMEVVVVGGALIRDHQRGSLLTHWGPLDGVICALSIKTSLNRGKNFEISIHPEALALK